MAKILICDDSNLILMVLEKRLQAAGHQVVGKARDGDECLELYKQLNPDLVLLDITMPNKDGRECLAELIEMDADASVAMISAVMEEEVKRECFTLGAKAFINKACLSSADAFAEGVLAVVKPLLRAG